MAALPAKLMVVIPVNDLLSTTQQVKSSRFDSIKKRPKCIELIPLRLVRLRVNLSDENGYAANLTETVFSDLSQPEPAPLILIKGSPRLAIIDR